MNCCRYFLTNSLKNNGRFTNYLLTKRLLSSKPPSQTKIVKEIDINTGEIRSKKSSNIIPKITLITSSNNDDTIQISTLDEAQKLAKRRNMKLVKIIDLDTKTNRPVYKLMTGSDYYLEELKQREQKKKDKQHNFIKGQKVLLLNNRISLHDLQTQINKCLKWIDKMYEIRVVISGDVENSEKIYKAFEEQFKDHEAKLVQKRHKGTDLRFQILPPKKKDDGQNNTQF